NMKHLIKNKDGSVAIMTTVRDDIDPNFEIEKWDSSIKEKVDSHRPILDESEVPEDRYFRDAWTHLEDKINVDMDKCREIHKDKLREIRRPILEALDLEYMKALEEGDEMKKEGVVIRKQLLRDVTIAPEIINAKTPEELKAFMPSILE